MELQQAIIDRWTASQQSLRQLRRAHKARRLSVQKAVEAKNADKASLIVKRRPAH